MPPSAEVDPGPHHHSGLPVTFSSLAEPHDARAARRVLHACREALADFPGTLADHAIYHGARAIVDALVARLDLMVDTRPYAGPAGTLLAAPDRAGGAARVARRLLWLRARYPDGTS